MLLTEVGVQKLAPPPQFVAVAYIQYIQYIHDSLRTNWRDRTDHQARTVLLKT
jgi:hypothetical protein